MAELLSELVDVNLLFLPVIEWSKIEQTLTPEQRAKYGETGFPYMATAEGTRYAYIPATINGQEFKCIQGKDPRA